jgi:hypothetical protein
MGMLLALSHQVKLCALIRFSSVHHRFLHSAQRRMIISLLLVAIVVRALVPAGFMPSPDRPFTLQICPDGFPAQLLHHAADMEPGFAQSGEHMAHGAHGSHEHGGQHEHGTARAEHCVFTALAAVAPPPQIAVLLTTLAGQAIPLSPAASPVFESARYRIQQPRGPPLLS